MNKDTIIFWKQIILTDIQVKLQMKVFDIVEIIHYLPTTSIAAVKMFIDERNQ